jgi:hypothetical protein
VIPVAGVEGYFGPLAPGDYIFREGNNTDHPFTVGAIPEPGALAAIGAAAALLARRRRIKAFRQA